MSLKVYLDSFQFVLTCLKKPDVWDTDVSTCVVPRLAFDFNLSNHFILTYTYFILR